MDRQQPMTEDREDEDDDIIMIRMDIEEPLNTIKAILEEQVEDIKAYKFTLQGGEELDGNKNLLDHCVQGEGQVQVNLVLKFGDTHNTIDIIDVLKPSDEDEEDMDESTNMDVSTDHNYDMDRTATQTAKKPGKAVNGNAKNSAKTPAKSPKKRKRKQTVGGTTKRSKAKKSTDIVPSKPPIGHNVPKTPFDQASQLNNHFLHTNTSNSSSTQLWQFLLDLLTSHAHRSSIQWLDGDGEFRLLNPEKVARLWGLKKNKPNMNYEKLSRSLRYYYDGDMIAKVPGKSFVYKFICDLKFMIGYTASELNSFVAEAEELAKGKKTNIPSLDFDLLTGSSSSPNSEVEIREGVVVPSDFNLE